MSRAFVREDRPDTEPLPDLPLSPHPNYVTPRGLHLLRQRLEQVRAHLSALRGRADRLDRMPEAAAERDIRYLEARLRTAILSPPPGDLSEVAFGLEVTVATPEGAEVTYQITGEDEADAAQHRIAPQSPLARALLGARIGDEVTWQKPGAAVTLAVIRIAHVDPPT